jgi:hypothetical protein
MIGIRAPSLSLDMKIRTKEPQDRHRIAAKSPLIDTVPARWGAMLKASFVYVLARAYGSGRVRRDDRCQGALTPKRGRCKKTVQNRG